MRPSLVLLTVLCVLLFMMLYESFSSALEDADLTGEFGSPVPGLSELERQRFEFGRTVFTRRFTREDGLGPHFNASSCKSCHAEPAPGGSSERYRDFFLAGRRQPDGTVAKLYADCTEENRASHKIECCLPSLIIPHYGPKGTIADPVAGDVEHPAIPGDADVVARRNTPPIFGVGLFRLVSDAEILSRADPEDSDGDGISGRVNRISTEDNAIGRFGYKCQTASLEAFTRGALRNQIGITSDSLELLLGKAERRPSPGLLRKLFGPRVAHAQVAAPRDRIVDFDGVFDPELRRWDLEALVFFQENLAAPRRGTPSRSAQRGEEVFGRIGCSSCHTPWLPTPAGTIHPFTDLLIHDMGPGLADGFDMQQATGSEFRTQPLWGLCRHAPFLHDGRADSVEEAILLHGGEAQSARDSYEILTGEEQQYLLRFLESL